MKKEWAKKVLGILLIILGIIGIFLPILQGILLIALGILLIKGEDSEKLIKKYSEKLKIPFLKNKNLKTKNLKKNKKAMELSFNLLFAIIAGSVILFLALYAVSKFVNTGEKIIGTQSASEFLALLKPTEAGISSGSSEQINFKTNTRIYLRCFEEGEFGKEKIAFSSIMRNKWSKKGYWNTFYNQYVFGEDVIEGKKFYVFSMPFNLPFKVADLVFVSTKKYCFYKAGEDVKNDIQGTGVENIQFVDNLNNCPDGSVRVCFDNGASCFNDEDINVFEVQGYVSKDGEDLIYTGNLLYGAIVSSPEIYKCNVKRLMKKFTHVEDLYREKMMNSGVTNMERDFNSMENIATSISNTGDLSGLKDLKNYAGEIERLNDNLLHGVY